MITITRSPSGEVTATLPPEGGDLEVLARTLAEAGLSVCLDHGPEQTGKVATVTVLRAAGEVGMTAEPTESAAGRDRGTKHPTPSRAGERQGLAVTPRSEDERDRDPAGSALEPVSLHSRLCPNLPVGLDPAGSGAALWNSVAASPLLLDPTETALLIMAVRQMDLADQLAAVVAAEGPLLAWGDSTRAHPLLSKITEHRGLAARCLASLKIAGEPKSGTGRRRRGVYANYRTGVTG